MREMKDSGIEWIGNIPKNWSICPIGCEFQEVLDKNLFLREKKSLKFTFGNIVDKKDFNENIDDYVEKTIRNYTVVKPGDIVLNGLNLNFDFVTLRIGQVKSKGLITSAYTSFRIIDSTKLSSDFVTYLFKSYDSCKAFHNMGGGVRKILNFSELKKNYFIFPSLQEQQKIADFLDEKCAEIDALTSDIQTQIETLEEYKKSVITEAVTKGLDPNVEMKDSGVMWIGKMPIHWALKKAGYLFIEKFSPAKGNEQQLSLSQKDGLVKTENMQEKAMKSKSFDGWKVVHVNNLVLNRFKAHLGVFFRSNYEGMVSFHYGVYVTKINLNVKYYEYLFHTHPYRDMYADFSNGITVGLQNLSNANFYKGKCLFPPIEEQNQIVHFLEKKCSEIDLTISEKQQQLETLAEYKKSLIYEYVTGKKEVA